jgi:hypothetical protein
VRIGANTRLLAWVAAVAALVLLYATLLLGEDTIDTLIREGGPIESLTAVALVVGAVFFALAFRCAMRDPNTGRIKRLALLLLALLLFFSAGEEVSWGQKIFNFSVPESIQEVNEQDELNVHNLEVFGGALSIDFLFKAFWAGFGVLIPVASAISSRFREVVGRFIPILPLWLAGLFVVNQLLGELATVGLRDSNLFNGSYGVEHSRQEILELGVTALLAVGAYVVWRDARRAVPRDVDPMSAPPGSSGPVPERA